MIRPAGALAVILVACMNRRPPVDEDEGEALEKVLALRQRGQMFGIDEPSAWSPVFIDFVDGLLAASASLPSQVRPRAARCMASK